MNSKLQRSLTLLSTACLLGLAAPASAAEPSVDTKRLASIDSAETRGGFFHDLLPISMQKWPKLRFNVFTEMTGEGRKRGAASPDAPRYYFSGGGSYVQMGWLPMAGEKAPRWEQLQGLMRDALAANGYQPVADDGQRRPDVLIVFTYGSHSTDLTELAYEPIVPPPVNAEEMIALLHTDRSAMRDVIDRARFIGGDKPAQEIITALNFDAATSTFAKTINQGFEIGAEPPPSAIIDLLRGSRGDTVAQVVELAFHPCYFITATAYDFSGVQKKQMIPLWQTRITVEAQGVDLREVLRPLIATAGPYLGRETEEAVMLNKRIDRAGRVEIGTATVVPEPSNAR